MAETIPPVPPLPITPAAGQSQPPVAEVPAPPPALVLLPPGTRLDATVTARLGPEAFQVVTPQATFVLQTPLPLDVGSHLLLLLPERPIASFPIQILTLNAGRPHCRPLPPPRRHHTASSPALPCWQRFCPASNLRPGASAKERRRWPSRRVQPLACRSVPQQA